jgi:peptidoglycan/LPS O-acetylase OafA/YrhL
MNASNEALPHKRLKYRPDIDGLRAVAVLSVLAFHLGHRRVQGGFVGVDVFFVISGYLISFIVFSEVAESRFSILSFYERRIRRIFPALFVMLAVLTIFAAIYLLPNELISYARALMAATGSASNFYFWLHSGYFDSAVSNPLLHTWSLGVEEQFYIAFPLCLVLVRRFFPQRLRVAVVVLLLLSLMYSGWLVHYSPVTTLFMLSTRAWELLMGTALSLSMFPALKHPVARNLVALAGIALIAYADMFYFATMVFPGFSALVPCLGSALIIGAGESGPSVVSAVLSWKPIVFIGLISYSVYLWHWPLIMVQNLGIFSPMNHLTLAIVSLVLGALSWKFVETPFRSGRLRMSGRPLFMTAGAVMLIFFAASAAILASNGIQGRFSPSVEQIASHLGSAGRDYELTRFPNCFLDLDTSFSNYRPDICLKEDPAKKKDYLLLGDDHSAVLWYALSRSIPEANILQASATPCKPLLHAIGSDACKQLMSFIFQSYLPTHRIQGLFIKARWHDSELEQLGETIQWARSNQIPVVVFGPTPEYDAPLPQLLAYSIARNKPDMAAKHQVLYLARLDAKMQNLAANTWHVPYVSLYQALCDKSGCTEFADAAHREPVLFDEDHLSKEGALLAIQRVIAQGELSTVQ